MPTLEQAIRTRSSALRRKHTLKGSRRRWGNRQESPLQACGDTFAGDIDRIERIYDDMINRINNAEIVL